MKFIEKKGIMGNILASLILVGIAPVIPVVKIINHLFENEESYPLKISKETEIDYKNLFRYLDNLEEKKIIEKESSNKKGKKVKIKLTPFLMDKIKEEGLFR